jgi:hypothetical protein
MSDDQAIVSVPAWRREIDALTAVCEILEPLDETTRLRALAAVMCTLDDDAAHAAVQAWQRKHGGL